MNRKIVRIISILFIIFIVFFVNINVFASTGSAITSQFNGSNAIGTSKGETLLTKIIGPILSVTRIVAVGIAIVMITFLGIKYMAAAPSEKASIKNQLVTFTIGAVVVVGTTSILTMLKNFATNSFK